MIKTERKYLVHLIDIAPLGDPASADTSETNYMRIGKDLEEYEESANPDISTSKNIWGEQTVIHNGYENSSSVDPHYVYTNDDGSVDEFSQKLMEIFNMRLTGNGTRTTKIDLLVDSDGKVIWAYREDVVVAVQSLGGDTSGIQIPYELHNDGGRTKGTYDMTTKTFTPDTAKESE